MKQIKKVDIFNQPVEKALMKLAWPIIVSNLLQTVYNITDAFFLGKLGKVEFSAPTVAWPIIFVFISLAGGFSQAGTSMVAGYTGMDNKKMAEKSAAQSMLTVTVISVAVMTIGLIFGKYFLNFMKVSDDVFELSHSYLNVILISMPFMFFMELISGIFRGWGNSFVPMMITGLSVTLNVILDPVFIFKFNLGVNGAAVATLISRIIFAGYFLYIIFSGKMGFQVHIKDFKPDFRYINKVLTIGLPSSVGQSVSAVGFAIITGVISAFGPAVISAYGVGNRITNIIVMVAAGLGFATSTMAGQYIGGNKPEKASETVRKASVTTFLIVMSFSVLLFFFGKYVTIFFINDEEVIKIGVKFFKLVSFSLPFFATMSILVGAMRGTGHTMQATVVDLLRLWAVRVPLVIFMADRFGFVGVFYAMIISNIFALVLSYIFLKFGNWKEKVVHEFE